MIKFPKRPRLDDEAGLSLVEVIMYSALTVLVLTVVGGMFFASFQAQATALERDTATGAAQVVSSSLQSGIGNASEVLVSTDAKMVQARVATGVAGWRCMAWVLTDDGNLVVKDSSTAITSTDYSTWVVLGTGATGQLAGGGAFSGTPTTAQFALKFASGKATAPVAGSVTANASGTGEPSSCW